MDHNDEAELIAEFIDESKSGLSEIESDLLALESAETSDSECVNRIFRAIHTIKGASGFFGLQNITDVSHRAESLLCKIRDGAAKATTQNVGIILESVDTLVSMFDDQQLGADRDVGKLLGDLERAIANDSGDPQATAADSQSESVEKAATKAQPASQTGGTATAPRSADTLTRVPTSVLSHLLQTTGEMVMARNQLLNSEANPDNAILEQLSRLISEVHETVLKTRKATTGTLFNRFQRIVRDLSLSLEKEVQLIIEGADLELDRSIIDAFADPLTHLVRNCVDHALEMPEQREAAGKPRCGSIWLRSTLQSGEIVLEIEDDGQGVDPEKIKRKAIEKGLITSEDAAKLDDQQSIELIFAPGFSTKETATDLSGRGVGMDVVKTNIEGIGGALSFESEVGKGTRITAHLPLAKALVTSSLTRTLIVTVGQKQFAIPDSAVCEIICPDAENYPCDFRALEHGEVFHLRGEILPMIHLADALGQQRLIFSSETGDYVHDPRPTLGPVGGAESLESMNQPPDVAVVIIRHRQHRFAMVVNDVLGIREAIVQPVPKLLEHCSAYTGHAVMGDGKCIFILDIGNIAKRKRLHVDSETNGPVAPQVTPDDTSAGEKLIVFNYSEDEYFAFPLDLAAFVFSTEKSQFRTFGGSTYYACQDRMLSVVFLDHYLNVKPLANAPYPETVILPANLNEDIAIACGGDLRVSELGSCFKSKSETDSCRIALFEQAGRLVSLLDIYRLAELHNPESAERPQPVKPARILCADDSLFFRRLLQQYLSDPQWELTLVENGRLAWEALDSQPKHYDLVITDINMPEMDGFELGSKIRNDRRFDDTPLIALTTQADKQSRHRGLELGFDEYVAKINKLALCRCIESVFSNHRPDAKPYLEAESIH